MYFKTNDSLKRILKPPKVTNEKGNKQESTLFIVATTIHITLDEQSQNKDLKILFTN